jgi:hypothetical protein
MLKSIKKQAKITIRQLLEASMDIKDEDDGFCIYAKSWGTPLSLDLECYLDSCSIVQDNGDEVFSNFITTNKLELIYYGERFVDVIHNVQHQKKDATLEEYVKALNYYSDNDTFLDF